MFRTPVERRARGGPNGHSARLFHHLFRQSVLGFGSLEGQKLAEGPPFATANHVKCRGIVAANCPRHTSRTCGLYEFNSNLARLELPILVATRPDSNHHGSPVLQTWCQGKEKVMQPDRLQFVSLLHE